MFRHAVGARRVLAPVTTSHWWTRERAGGGREEEGMIGEGESAVKAGISG